MGENSKIEWCHHTANTWWGCQKVSAGCKNCYAEAWSKYAGGGGRDGMGAAAGGGLWGPNSSRRMMKGVWHSVRKWALAAASAGERRRVFWGSMMDVCEDRPELAEPRKRFCGIIEELEDLDFLILTKRPENYLAMMPWGTGAWPANAWAGTSVEDQENLEKRWVHLAAVPARLRWFSIEPLLAPVDVDRAVWTHSPNSLVKGEAVDWIIVGGESGGGARPFDVAWARSIVEQCQAAGVPVFVKQLGARAISSPTHSQPGFNFEFHDRKGGDPAEWPADLRVREFPKVGAT